jgi:hypothetical protein
VAWAYDGLAEAGPEIARHPQSATAASDSPLTFIFLTQRVGTTLCLRTGLMMIETGEEANPPRTAMKKSG